MPERNFDTDYWTNPKIERLSVYAKLLYIYLWTNSRCNPAGLYEIGIDTIFRETKIPEDAIRQSFKELNKKVVWVEDENIVWVKNFIRRQVRTPKFLKGTVKYLRSTSNLKLVRDLLSYNESRYNIAIPYQYDMDMIPNHLGLGLGLGLGTKDKGGVGGEDVDAGNNRKPLRGKSDVNLSNIVNCYLENIGMVTPLIADELRDIADTYPAGWFQEAVAIACSHNKRKLSYINAILTNWNKEGKNGLGETVNGRNSGNKYRGNTSQRPSGAFSHLEERDRAMSDLRKGLSGESGDNP